MKKIRFATLVLVVLTSLLSLSGCKGIKKLEDMKITSAKIESIMPDGLKGMVLDIAVGVDNPGTQVSLSEISCSFKHSGKVLGKVAVDPFTLNAKTADVYHLKANVQLGENTSLFDFGRFLDKSALDEAVLDLSADVKLKSGLSKKLVYNDIPLKKLLEAAK